MSLVELEHDRDQHSNVLSSSKYEKSPLKNDSESPEDCARSNNEEASAFGTGKEVPKFFVDMVWYSVTVESSRDQFGCSKTYTVRFDDIEYEECSDK